MGAGTMCGTVQGRPPQNRSYGASADARVKHTTAKSVGTGDPDG